MFTLKKFGSFTVPGRKIQIANQPLKTIQRNKDVSIEIDPNGEYSIENMYVQYFIPPAASCSVIFIHGGGLTGAIWENTPDGREGWLHYFLKNNFGVYIVDTVERGRAGWCPFPETWPGEPELRSAECTWTAFRIDDDQGFEKKEPFDDQQFPVEAFDQLVALNVPRWNCNAECSAQALATLIRKIGSCSIIAHSQGSEIAMRAVEMVPSLIQKVILVELASFYKFEAAEQFKDIEAMILLGDFINKNPFWQSLRQLTLQYAKHLSQNQIYVDLQELPDIGVKGNSHVMMLDKNNAIVAEHIINWLINPKANLQKSLAL